MFFLLEQKCDNLRNLEVKKIDPIREGTMKHDSENASYHSNGIITRVANKEFEGFNATEIYCQGIIIQGREAMYCFYIL